MEKFAIDANDSAEVKAVKEKFNIVYADLEAKGNKDKEQLQNEFKGEIKQLIETNSDVKSNLQKLTLLRVTVSATVG